MDGEHMRSCIADQAETHDVFLHRCAMSPKEIIKQLIEARGETTTSVVSKTKPKMVQSTLHRYLESSTKEPRRSTMQPLADFLGVPVEAFFDASIAAKFAPAGSVVAQTPSETQSAPGVYQIHPLSVDTLLEQLGICLAALPAGMRRAVADNLSGFALDGGADHWRHALLALLIQPKPRAGKRS
jgi:hypothetical protein